MTINWDLSDPDDILNKNAVESARLGLKLMACLNLSRLLYDLGIKSSSNFAAHTWFHFVKRLEIENVRRTK